MKIKLSTDIQPFSFTGDSKTFVDAVFKTMMVTGYVSKADLGRYHLVIAQNKKVYVAGYSDETGCIVELEGFKSKGSGAFVLNEPERLKLLFKAKKDVDFEFDGNTIKYKAVGSSFKGTFTCSLVSMDQVPRINFLADLHTNTKENGVSDKLVQELRTAIKFTNISDVHMKRVLLCFVEFDGSKLSVSNYDDFHAASYVKKVKAKDKPFKLGLPATMFQTADRFLDKESEFTYAMDSSSFAIVGKKFIISFPPTQAEDDEFTNVFTYNENILVDPVAVTSMSKSLKEAQENLRAYFIDGHRLKVTLTKKGVFSIGIANDLGTSDFQIKCKEIESKKDIQGSFDPRTLADTLNLFPAAQRYKMEFFDNEESEFEDLDFASFRISFDYEGAAVKYNVSTMT